MAFTKTQSLDSVLLRQLNFRTPLNAPISSLYSLYATGNGQTYWSNSVTPQNLSSVSTVFGSTLSLVYTGFLSSSASLENQIVSTNLNLISTTGGLLANDSNLTQSINNLSNWTGSNFTNLFTQYNSIYNSTLQLVNSSLTSTTIALTNMTVSTVASISDYIVTVSTGVGTELSTAVTNFSTAISSLFSTFIYINDSTIAYANSTTEAAMSFINSSIIGISSISSFYTELSLVQSSINDGLSTVYSSLSSLIEYQNVSTYVAITSSYEYYVQSSLISTIIYVDTKFLNASNTYVTLTNFDTFSTTITDQLISTSAGLTSNVSTIGISTLQIISSIFYSTVQPLESTTTSLFSQVSSLQAFSTSMSSITGVWISSLVSTSQGFQNSSIFASNTYLSTQIGGAYTSTYKITSDFIIFSTFATPQLQNQASSFSYLNSTIADLTYQFSVITTSSILAGIYETFIQLEGYTSTLIGSTIASTDEFKSSLGYSTSVQNMSISQSYFDFYVSTLYASTLSTLIPSTIEFTSSMVSSLYSTATTALNLALNSTTVSLTDQFYISTVSLTSSIILSTSAQLESSIIGYISTPGGWALSSFSSLGFISLSTFAGQGSTLLSNQSSIFGSTFVSNNRLFNNLYISTLDLYSSLSTQLSTNLVLIGRQLSTFSTQFTAQMSTQSGLFTSTLLTYPSTLTGFATSTNTVITSTSIGIASTTLSNIQTQTLAAYGAFTSSLNTATAGVSSLYTVQNINLNSNNFIGTLDFVTNRNFNVNVFNILSNATSSYRLTYNISSIDSNLNYRQGVININVSTVGQSYSNYNSKLRLDTYTWGLPTTIWGGIYPFISNSDYLMEYSYTILNNTVYTTLNNVYPRIEVRAPTIVPIVQNVNDSSSGWLSNGFWRGTPCTLRWSNYCYFPFQSLGAPPFNPEIMVEVYQSNTLLAEYGPYDLSVSSATIITPYLSNTSNASNAIRTRVQIVGNPQRAVETTLTSFLPLFDTATYENYLSFVPALLGGTELVMITDNRNYPMYNKPVVWDNVTSSISTYNGSSDFVANNLVNGILNFAGSNSFVSTQIVFGSSNVVGQFTETSATSGYNDFYINLGNDYFFAASTIRQFNSDIQFSITNGVSSIVLSSMFISSITNTLFRLFNLSQTKTSNTFGSGTPNCFIRYNYNPVNFISSLGIYNESTFIGPNPGGVPDNLSRVRFTNLRSNVEPTDSVSTVIYYNLLPNAIPPSPVQYSTAGSVLRLGFSNRYSSTFTITTAARQVFNF